MVEIFIEMGDVKMSILNDFSVVIKLMKFKKFCRTIKIVKIKNQKRKKMRRKIKEKLQI